jgi:hypothetical protein
MSLRVMCDRAEQAAGPAVSASPRKRPTTVLSPHVAKGQVQTCSCQPNCERPTICIRKVRAAVTRTQQGERHADSKRIRGFCFVRIVRNC